GFEPGDAYGNMVRGFQHWYVFVAYAVAMVALGAHVHHGFNSMVQTLGAAGRYRHLARLVAMGSAGLLVVGYLSGPAAILFGFIGS
ncbi:MAG: succinate dehydrogenase, partial [Mycobacteriales bacterium]